MNLYYGLKKTIFFLNKVANYDRLNLMKKEKTYITPKISVLGNANEIIKGLLFGKETGGADGLRDDNNNPVSVPD